jgi:hypothetical protein
MTFLPPGEPIVYEVCLVVDEENVTTESGAQAKRLKLARIGVLEDVDLKSAAVAGLGALGRKFNQSCAPERIVVRHVSGHPSSKPGMMSRPLANISEAEMMGMFQKLNTVHLETLSRKLAEQCQWELGAIQGAGAPGIQGQVLAPAERLRQASLLETSKQVASTLKKLMPPDGGGQQALPPAPLAPPSGDILDAPISNPFGNKRRR